ncbi:MAG: leucyl aminopeptidase [Bacteroidota bacterium]|nr:leucyl aminopeptidase [Bacteroidota bacterium]
MVKCTGLYGNPARVPADVHILFFVDEERLFKATAGLFDSAGSTLLLGLRERGDFKGRPDETMVVACGDLRCVLVGVGKADQLNPETFRKAAGRGIKEAAKFSAPVAAVYCPSEEVIKKHVKAAFEDVVVALVDGTLLGNYRYEKYIGKKAEPVKGPLRECRFVTADEGYQGRLKSTIDSASIVVEGVILARDLTNAPPSEITPDTLAKEALAMGRKYGLKTVILGKKEIEQHKMAGLLAVNRGSRREPRFIIVEHNETKRRLPLYVLIGKGITFDSGGLSLKPAASMEEMKMDMAGAAAVLGTLMAAARLKIPLRIVGLIPATDNMPGGNALYPGDIIRFANGKTVEVVNTDAEGRLILADALLYAQRYKPEALIDIATLTGACAVALGSHATGLLGTGEGLKSALIAAGVKTAERVWELPLFEEYESQLKSTVADMKNVGGKWAGAITAAAFLKVFAGDIPWAHLDIAGTAILEEATDYAPKGGSGVGVRLLTEFFRTMAS